MPIYVQAAEWELAHTTDHTILEWIDFPGATYVPLTGDHEPFDGFRIIATPGHTKGHQSLAVQTDQGLVVLAGQAVYTVDEWAGEPDELEGRSGAPDRDAYDRSLERLRGAGARAGLLRPRPAVLAADRILTRLDRSGVSLAGRARRGTSGALYLQSAPAGPNPLPRSSFS